MFRKYFELCLFISIFESVVIQATFSYHDKLFFLLICFQNFADLFEVVIEGFFVGLAFFLVLEWVFCTARMDANCGVEIVGSECKIVGIFSIFNVSSRKQILLHAISFPTGNHSFKIRIMLLLSMILTFKRPIRHIRSDIEYF